NRGDRRQQVGVRQPDHDARDPRDPRRLTLKHGLHAPRHPLIAGQLLDAVLHLGVRRPVGVLTLFLRVSRLPPVRSRAATPLPTSAATTRASTRTAISILGGTEV